MAHEVFISYSSKDKAIADRVCAVLEQSDIRCWIAPRDVEPGSDYGASLLDAISKSAAMVLVLSTHSNKSSPVRREIERAASKDIPIVPFLVEEVTLSKSLEFFISTHHWLDATSRPIEPHYEKLRGAITGLVRSCPGRSGNRNEQDSRELVEAPVRPLRNGRDDAKVQIHMRLGELYMKKELVDMAIQEFEAAKGILEKIGYDPHTEQHKNGIAKLRLHRDV